MNDTFVNSNFFDEKSENLIRPASIFSLLTHLLIIIIAIYGLPNFGRKLPDNLTVIPIEILPLVEKTNLDPKPLLPKKNEIEIDKSDKPIKIKPKNIPQEKVLQKNKSIPPDIPVKSPIIETVDLPPEKPVVRENIKLPSKKPDFIKPPQKKIKSLNQNNIDKNPNSKILKQIKKPITKPMIKKKIVKEEKIKKQITNPNALTSVLKTLEEIKETKIKDEEIKIKRTDAASSLKDMVKNAVSNKAKSVLKPLGIDKLDLLKQHLKQCWNPPVGAAGAENLIVDIFIELNSQGYVEKVDWVNRGMNGKNSFYIAAANAAIRAVKDCEPLPLPTENYNQWKSLTMVFDPKIMFGGY